MSQSNFRAKLDLCKYYHDVRRFCWIFIDGTKMLQIFHIKEHITKLFNIKEPFHLLLNESEYLPPDEDIRILKENETIIVSPGSGLTNELLLSNDNGMVSENQNEFIKIENTNNTLRHKESQTVDCTDTKPKSISSTAQDALNDTLRARQSDTSTGDLTFHSVVEDSKVDSATESKATDSNITEDSGMEHMIPKKKRIRRRKQKSQTLVKNIVQDKIQSKKPKIINSLIISSGKHIRFDTIDSEDKEMIHNDSKNECFMTKASSSQDLSSLLSLSYSSTPLTFTKKRVKQEIKVERISDEESRNSVPSVETDKKVIQVNGNAPSVTTCTHKDLQEYPIMTTKPQVKDIIAFKMLKIGADYTPQISESIVGEVLSCSPETTVYTFHILQGVSEVQVPIGKFTVMEDEAEHVMDDTITLNYAQIIEPRLVSKSDLSKANKPTCSDI